jgi:phosphoglycerate kinase
MHLPTIRKLLDLGNKIIIISHFGRPKSYDENFSLAKIRNSLEENLQEKILFIADMDFKKISEELKKNYKIAMLENIRFFKGETENSAELAKNLANLADIYVNDAFSASHRSHASIVAITEYLPSYAGLLMSEEIEYLSLALNDTRKPSLVIVGGSKLSTKLPLIRSLLTKFDHVFIGGAMANNFLKVQNVDIGYSLFEPDYLADAINLLENFADKIILPIDYVISENKILDIGENTIKLLQEKINSCKIIIWNGPLGMYEIDSFAKGSLAIAKYLRDKAQNDESGCRIVIGGGDTIAVYNKMPAELISPSNLYLSTSGGAFLSFLEKGKL